MPLRRSARSTHLEGSRWIGFIGCWENGPPVEDAGVWSKNWLRHMADQPDTNLGPLPKAMAPRQQPHSVAPRQLSGLIELCTGFYVQMAGGSL